MMMVKKPKRRQVFMGHMLGSNFLFSSKNLGAYGDGGSYFLRNFDAS